MGIQFLKILFIIIVVIAILFFLRLSRTLGYEKRLGSYAISVTAKEISLFDRFYQILWKFVQFFSKLLRKSVVLSNYGKKYEKYITFEEREIKEGIDYISLKFVILFFVFLLSLITLCIHPNGFNVGILLLILILSFFLPDIFLKISFSKKRKQVEEDLLKAIIIMNNAFMSGRNIMQAIEIVKNELDGPIQDEFKKIYLDITYGLSLDVVFGRFYERVKLEDAKYITSSLTLLNKTGGDIIKVFSMIEKSILQRKNLKNELKSLTAASEFVYKFLIALPIVFVLIIFLLNPTYFEVLYTTTIGFIFLGIILLLYILYIVIVKKIMEVRL